MTEARIYRVEYRRWDHMDDDIDVAECTVRATSAHEAITYGWPIMKSSVEFYGGTIDDLDAWEIKNIPTAMRTKLAKSIYSVLTGSPIDTWDTLQNEKKNHYLRAADAALNVLERE